jgi:hypothetical protein
LLLLDSFYFFIFFFDAFKYFNTQFAQFVCSTHILHIFLAK